ncbi:MAG: ubiquitin-like domain-containing protein [Angustibacter sp.]
MRGRLDVWTDVLARPLRLALQAVTLTGVVVGTVAVAGFDKNIELSVDGRTSTVHAFGDTVADVLAGQGIQVGERDVVSPAMTAEVQDGAVVAVRFGRLLTVTADGRTERHWTTALTVGEALRQVSVRTDAARLSVPRSTRLGRQGLTMTVNTRKDLTLVVGGTRSTVSTYAGTVEALLQERSLTVGRLDRLQPAAGRPVPDGGVVRLDRVEQREVSTDRSIPFAITSTKDPKLDKGTTTVTAKGKRGRERVTYLVTYVNGKATSRKKIGSDVRAKPVTQKQRVGTKPVDPNLPDFPQSVDDLNWAALADCESSGNPRAVNPNGHYGLYQFSLSTWASVGGTGNPIDASPAEQTARAKTLYVKAGAGQWSCGSRLFI